MKMDMSIRTGNIPIILASQSPRRADLLRQAGIAFEVISPRHEEPDMHRWQLTPAEYAESTSYFKARSVADDFPDSLIIAADTVVSLNGKMMGKPEDEEDARRILSTLMGTTHEVITGVTLCESSTSRRIINHAVTKVTMREMTEQELSDYLASREWEGKAGAYGIQDNADKFVTRTEGSFSNIIGLPMELVEEMLAEFGMANS